MNEPTKDNIMKTLALDLTSCDIIRTKEKRQKSVLKRPMWPSYLQEDGSKIKVLAAENIT